MNPRCLKEANNLSSNLELVNNFKSISLKSKKIDEIRI